MTLKKLGDETATLRTCIRSVIVTKARLENFEEEFKLVDLERRPLEGEHVRRQIAREVDELNKRTYSSKGGEQGTPAACYNPIKAADLEPVLQRVLRCKSKERAIDDRSEACKRC